MRFGKRRVVAGAAMGAAAAILVSCAPNTTWVQANDTAAWPGMYGDSRNNSFADRDAAGALAPAWVRPIHGPNLAQAAISNRGIVSVTGLPETGCSTFNLDLSVGRKTYCRRDAPGADLQTPLVDQFENTYLGIPGWLYSFNPDNQVRWRYPTAGTPLWTKLAGANNVLAVTQLGQLVLVDSHAGTAAASGIGLLPTVSANNNGGGLADCATNGPACPVSGPPAVDTEAERAYVVVAPDGSPSKVMAVDYGVQGDRNSLRYRWERTDLASGVIGSPALSADRTTLYVNLRSGELAALDAQTGVTKWVHDLGYQTATPPSVSPDGTIIPAFSGLDRGNFVGLRDNGDSATEVFRRTDVAMVAPATQVRGGIGYTVVRSWAGGGAQLIEFDAATGGTLRSFDLPDNVESSAGVSIGPNGELVAATNVGDVYAFTPDGSPFLSAE